MLTKWLNKQKPVFIKTPKLLTMLGKILPIQPRAFSFCIWVFCVDELTEKNIVHETIHYRQQVELLFLGMWILYLFYFIKNYLKSRDGAESYRNIPFEKEARYGSEMENYLQSRSLYNWRHFLR